MSRKVNDLLKKYEDKLDTCLWLYSKGMNDWNEFISDVYDREKEFDGLVTNMFHYDLLSEKDFRELMKLVRQTKDKYVDKALEIAC